MPKPKAPQFVDVKEALRIVERLEQQAGKANHESLKKILLVAGCEIADLVLAQQGELSKAA